MKATIINKQTGERIEVRSTSRHPMCSYGQAIWVDSDNNPYLQVKLRGTYYTDAPLYKVELDHRALQRYELGQQIASARRAKGLSVRELAQQANINAANLCRIEQGDYNASVDIINRICDALGVKLLIK